MATAIYSYNQGSASAKALAEALGIKRIKHQGSKFKPAGNTIINWGSSNLPPSYLEQAQIINEPEAVSVVTNKLRFFQLLYDNPWVVPHTTSNNQVREWLADGKTVVARTKLTGHSGEGIVLIEGANAGIVEAPLYTLYVPKKHEYRVHCYRVNDSEDVGVKTYIFDAQQKKRRTDVEDANVNWKIRNLDGGFIYAREGIAPPDCVRDCALEVFNQTGLDFGAVDIIFNAKDNKAYALEVNTAPGLSGTTLQNYVNMLKDFLHI